MKQKFVFIGLFLFSLLSNAQEFKVSDLHQLQFLPGKVNTYYSTGTEEKAKYLQQLVQDAVLFFENKLNDTLETKLLVMNRSDWKTFVGGPYFLYDFSNNPNRISMGINDFFKMKLPKDRTLCGKNEVFLWDLVVVHELGHCISQHKKIKSVRWTSEFFADYIMIGYILEYIPDWQFPLGVCKSFKYLPFKYKTFEDFQVNYNRIGPLNTIFYQVKLDELAYRIHKEKGWDFLFDYISKFSRNLNPPPDKNKILELSVAGFQQLETNLFDIWKKDMKKSFHPYIIFFILLVLIGSIKLIDNSYRLFIFYGFKTKKRYMIFGIPTLQIISKFKVIDDHMAKNKLKIIIWFRPLLYLLLFILLIFISLHFL